MKDRAKEDNRAYYDSLREEFKLRWDVFVNPDDEVAVKALADDRDRRKAFHLKEEEKAEARREAYRASPEYEEVTISHKSESCSCCNHCNCSRSGYRSNWCPR